MYTVLYNTVPHEYSTYQYTTDTNEAISKHRQSL